MKQIRRYEEFSVWRRGTKGIINGLVDEYVERAIDSFDALYAGLDAAFVCHIHLESVGVLTADILEKDDH